MQLKNDQDFTDTLNEIQNLYETIESVREETTNQDEFEAIIEPMNSKIEMLQEVATRYFEEHKNEET